MTLISPTGGATAFGDRPLQKTYTVGGIFTVGHEPSTTSAFIFMPLEQAQLFFGRRASGDVIEVKVDRARPGRRR